MTGDYDDDEPTYAAFTYRKKDRKLNIGGDDDIDRQIDRQAVDGNEFPPPEDNDLLQLESRLNSTQLEDIDYDQYFDYLYKDGEILMFIFLV